MKKSGFLVLVLGLFLSLGVYADCGGKSCPKGSHHRGGEEGGCPIAGKVLQTSCFLLNNAKEIGLSEDQIKTIQQIKTDTVKQGIQAKAGMEVFMIDMQSKLSEDKLDVDGITKMIDEGTKAMTDGAKASLAALAKLKETVKPDQLKKAKELCGKDCKK